MAIKAIAFHETISVQKLAELFKPEIAQLFAGTTAAHCKNCGKQYAVFFPVADDPKNLGCVTDLEKQIAEDCNKGNHKLLEIRLDVKP